MTNDKREPENTFRREEELFHELLSLEGEARTQRLSDLRESEPKLAGRLESLLSLQLVGSVSDTSTESALAAPPARIPGYRLGRVLGQGGMGVVYEAHQEEPVDRRVALKLVRASFASQAVLERFRTEQQALAVMDHPNIARVFDAGVAEDGRPYFAMELIEGEAITDYCDRMRLRTADRLKLFGSVCEAVQHAHRKGVIHRDLKPSNIMVTEVDGRPIVKVIDFGIAKAVGEAEAVARRGTTRFGDLVGTPEYMSPEQAGAGDVDTRSDVYSLGVVLFELLVGELPLHRRVFEEAALEEIRRLVREGDTPRPSERLTASSDQGQTIAERRSTDAGSLARSVQGDLDWIVLRALAKQRDDRYGSASELAEDIGRHLRHEPVLAGPPSFLYRSRKLVRRHRVAVATVAGILLSLVVGLLVTSLALVRANRAEEQALQEAARANRVTDFVKEIFRSADPRYRAEEPTVQELLDEGAERVDLELDGEPLVRAQLLSLMGGVYSRLGNHESGLELSGRAVQLIESLDTASGAEIARVMSDRYNVLYEAGDYGAAEAAIRASLEGFNRSSESKSELLAAQIDLGNILSVLGRTDEGSQILEEVLETLDVESPESYGRTRILYRLAANKRQKGLLEEARLGMLETLQLQESLLGPNHVETAITLNALGGIEVEVGRFEDAEKRLQEGLKMYEERLGANHLRLLEPLTNQANLYWRLGQTARAASSQERAVEICRALLDGMHPDCAQPFMNLGVLYRSTEGRGAEGMKLIAESVALRESSLGEGHPDMAFPLSSLADAYLNDGDLDAAESTALRAVAVLTSNDSAAVQVMLLAEGVLARVEAQRGENDEAESRFLKILDAVQGSQLARSIEEARVLSWIGEFYVSLGRGKDAIPMIESSIQLVRELNYEVEETVQELNDLLEAARALE